MMTRGCCFGDAMPNTWRIQGKKKYLCVLGVFFGQGEAQQVAGGICSPTRS